MCESRMVAAEKKRENINLVLVQNFAQVLVLQIFVLLVLNFAGF